MKIITSIIILVYSFIFVVVNSNLLSLNSKGKLFNSNSDVKKNKSFKATKSFELIKEIIPDLIYDFKLASCDLPGCCIEYLSFNKNELSVYHDKLDYSSKTIADDKLFIYDDFKNVLNSVAFKKCKCSLKKEFTCEDILKFKKEYKEDNVNRKIRNYFPAPKNSKSKKEDLLIDTLIKDRNSEEVGNILARVNKISAEQ